MNTKDTLRLMGYAVTADGNSIECHPGVPPRHDLVDPNPRFELLRTAVVSIEITHGPRDAATRLVDKWLAAVDQPRALCGRAKNGGAILLFKHERAFPVVEGAAVANAGIHQLATRDGEVKFTITAKSQGVTVAVGDYTWGKNRSPLETARDILPTLSLDVAKAAVDCTLALNCSSAALVESQRLQDEETKERMARVASGELKLDRTEQEIREEEENQLVADNAGKYIPGYGNAMEQIITRARQAVANRRRARANVDRDDAEDERRAASLLGG